MERWYWRAVYNDGSGVCQLQINPDTGREWSSDHVDLSKLFAIVFEPKDDKSNRVVLQVREGEKPIRFWRHSVSGSFKDTCWVLGLEKQGIAFYVFFKPDGNIVISTDLNGSRFNVPVDKSLDELTKKT